MAAAAAFATTTATANFTFTFVPPKSAFGVAGCAAAAAAAAVDDVNADGNRENSCALERTHRHKFNVTAATFVRMALLCWLRVQPELMNELTNEPTWVWLLPLRYEIAKHCQQGSLCLCARRTVEPPSAGAALLCAQTLGHKKRKLAHMLLPLPLMQAGELARRGQPASQQRQARRMGQKVLQCNMQRVCCFGGFGFSCCRCRWLCGRVPLCS